MSAGLSLEVLVGSVRLTAAFRAHPQFRNKVADAWDILHGKKFDLLVEGNLTRLLHLVILGHIAGVWPSYAAGRLTQSAHCDAGTRVCTNPRATTAGVLCIAATPGISQSKCDEGFIVCVCMV